MAAPKKQQEGKAPKQEAPKQSAPRKTRGTAPKAQAPRMGRKPKLEVDPTIKETICLFLKGGNTRRASALSAGIDEKTFYNWMNRGQQEKTGQYFQFFQAVMRAEAECEVLMVDSIRTAARPHEVIESETIDTGEGKPRKVERRKHVHKPEMALEWLKRRRRDEWGDSIDIRKLDDETLLRLLEAANK